MPRRLVAGAAAEAEDGEDQDAGDDEEDESGDGEDEISGGALGGGGGGERLKDIGDAMFGDARNLGLQQKA